MRSFFSLKVHSWGGLGSQLFALCFALEMQQRQLRKKIVLVLHSGGVTRRNSELNSIQLENFRIVQVDDFAESSQIGSSIKQEPRDSLKLGFLKLAKAFLSNLGFLITTDPPDGKIRIWTTHVRSHYYKRSVPDTVLKDLTKLLIDNGNLNYSPLDLGVVHYRLGDLVNLESKSPLDISRVRSAVAKASEINPSLKWTIASDSPIEALESLSRAANSPHISKLEGSPWETLKALSRSRVLIASPSKLSVWGIIFGIVLHIDRTVFLTKELLHDIKLITPLVGRTTFVIF